MLLCQMTRRGLGALELLWNPDCGGVIPQANGPAFEVLDADPGTNQAIEHVFHRLERRQCCHLGGLGNELRDAVDVLIKAGFDGFELLEQPFNPLAAPQLFGFRVSA